VFNSRNYTVQTLPGKFDLLALAQQASARYPYLLESTAQSLSDTAKTSRFNILMAFPQQQLRKNWLGELYLDDNLLPQTSFLQSLNELYRQSANTEPLPLPFAGGWFLYLGYELADEIEPGLGFPCTAQQLPLALATRIPAAIIYDHVTDLTHVIAENAFAYSVRLMLEDLNALANTELNEMPDAMVIEEEPAQNYVDNVKRVLEYIKEGDVFQVNLSRQWHVAHHGEFSSHTIYRQLRNSNPAPFSAYVQIDNVTILSSSPERLVRVQAGKIETRPIAGTRPRGLDQEDDTQLQAELIDNLKERAEHVMLIDLERNDLGRVCKPGSILVDEMMVVESYAHVHHIVSNISGCLKQNILPGDIIAAVFPGGTITGCPKVRCMQIIQELEQTIRGAYTGSLGYLNHNGDMDLNILIRSIVIDNEHISVRAGAGLVADSIPEWELEETRSKAKGLLLALGG